MSTQFLSRLACHRDDAEPCPIPCIVEPLRNPCFLPIMQKLKICGRRFWHCGMIPTLKILTGYKSYTMIKPSEKGVSQLRGTFSLHCLSCKPILLSGLPWHLQLSKLPQDKNSLAQFSPIFLLLSQNPWIQTWSSSTPALCPQERSAATTCESGR